MIFQIGKLLIFFGFFLIFLGIIFTLFGKIFHLGKLPGDILIRRENFTFYFPLTTSLLLSLILSVIFYLISKIFK